MDLIQEISDFVSEYVFLNNYVGRMDAGNFRNLLHKYVEDAGINIRVHPHLFRHTGATMFLEAGGDIRHLQVLDTRIFVWLCAILIY